LSVKPLRVPGITPHMPLAAHVPGIAEPRECYSTLFGTESFYATLFWLYVPVSWRLCFISKYYQGKQSNLEWKWWRAINWQCCESLYAALLRLGNLKMMSGRLVGRLTRASAAVRLTPQPQCMFEIYTTSASTSRSFHKGFIENSVFALFVFLNALLRYL